MENKRKYITAKEHIELIEALGERCTCITCKMKDIDIQSINDTLCKVYNMKTQKGIVIKRKDFNIILKILIMGEDENNIVECDDALKVLVKEVRGLYEVKDSGF